MLSRLAAEIRNLARIISEDVSSALWLFIGAGAVRLLIRLASKLPMHLRKRQAGSRTAINSWRPSNRPVVGAVRPGCRAPSPDAD
jgi:hypothetical protein